jgi:hypothetical protein
MQIDLVSLAQRLLYLFHLPLGKLKMPVGVFYPALF